MLYSFVQKYLSVLKAKENYSYITQDRYHHIFFDDNPEVKKSEGKSFIKNTKTDSSPSASSFICCECFELRSFIFDLQNDVTLKTAESKELNSLLNPQKELLQKDFEGADTKPSFLEEQLHYFSRKASTG